MTDRELADWLEPVKRPVVRDRLHVGERPVPQPALGPGPRGVTATRSGNEQNYARFGRYIAEAIADPEADLDKDGQVSLLEAISRPAIAVAEYYRTRSQLATEHALLDDNGDRLGTPPDWFRGVRATRRAKDGAPPDGIRAHQLHLVPSDRERKIPAPVRRRRDELELAIAALRDKKAKLPEDDYYTAARAAHGRAGTPVSTGRSPRDGGLDTTEIRAGPIASPFVRTGTLAASPRFTVGCAKLSYRRKFTTRGPFLLIIQV